MTHLTTLISQQSQFQNAHVFDNSWCKNSKFAGNPIEFHSWIKSVIKRGIELSLESNRWYILALQSSQEEVSNFIIRYFQNKNAPIVWNLFLKDLKNRFGIYREIEHANVQLSGCKQKSNETASMFCERIIELAKVTDADQFDTLQTQTRLQTIFLKGLIDQSILNLIQIQSPKTLDETLNAVRLLEHIPENLDTCNENEIKTIHKVSKQMSMHGNTKLLTHENLKSVRQPMMVQHGRSQGTRLLSWEK